MEHVVKRTAGLGILALICHAHIGFASTALATAMTGRPRWTCTEIHIDAISEVVSRATQECKCDDNLP